MVDNRLCSRPPQYKSELGADEMDSCLVLLTNYFPFFKGEEYLETELPILAVKYDKIFLIACMIDETQKQTREVPDNVVVIPSGVNHGKLGRIKMLLNSLVVSPRESEHLNVSQRMYSKYFEARSLMISEQVMNKLKTHSFEEYKTVTIYSYWLYITARVAIELKKNHFKTFEPKIITRTHRYDLYEEVTQLSFLPERQYLLSQLDWIFPVSDDGTDYLKRKYPEFISKIATRRLGTIKPFFEWEKTLDKPLHLVSCSALRPVKRIDLIVDAIASLQKKGLSIRWTHLGDGQLFDQIKISATDKLLPDTFEFAGFMPNNKVLEYYKDKGAHLFLNVSKSEGVPVSIMEAISVGLPVIATDVGGTREIVEDGTNGTLLDANTNAVELAEAINAVYRLNQESYFQLAINAESIWKHKYDGQKNYEDFADELLYEQGS